MESAARMIKNCTSDIWAHFVTLHCKTVGISVSSDNLLVGDKCLNDLILMNYSSCSSGKTWEKEHIQQGNIEENKILGIMHILICSHCSSAQEEEEGEQIHLIEGRNISIGPIKTTACCDCQRSRLSDYGWFSTKHSVMFIVPESNPKVKTTAFVFATPSVTYQITLENELVNWINQHQYMYRE